jgi:pimeloyl-ACP methyl ester carboxylesterase
LLPPCAHPSTIRAHNARPGALPRRLTQPSNVLRSLPDNPSGPACAFAPDKDQSVNTLISGFPADALQPPILPPKDGFLFLDRDMFHASFAADLPDRQGVRRQQATFMADSQVPWGVGALGGAVTEPAWRTKPSWYLVTSQDRMIPPPAQHAMAEKAGATVSEVAASHSVYLWQPEAVATLIAKAAGER